MAHRETGLGNSDYARLAWARFRRIMRWMGVVALGAVLVALAWLQWFGSGLTLHVAIATSLAVGLTIIVAAALMGLIFLSSGSGHDEDVERRIDDR